MRCFDLPLQRPQPTDEKRFFRLVIVCQRFVQLVFGLAYLGVQPPDFDLMLPDELLVLDSLFGRERQFLDNQILWPLATRSPTRRGRWRSQRQKRYQTQVDQQQTNDGRYQHCLLAHQ